MLGTGLEVLPNGENVAVHCPEIGHHRPHLSIGFPETNHNARLGVHPRCAIAGLAQEFERSPVISLGAHPTVKAGHGFGIVVQHLGSGGENAIQCLPIATEIGNQHLNSGGGHAGTHGSNAADKLRRATVRQIVPIHRRNYDMIQAQPGYGLSKAIGFRWVEGLGCFGKINIAVGAGTGAGRAHDQKRGRARLEALPNVGARGLFANRIQT